MQRLRSGETGFALLEVIVAMTIASVALAVIYRTVGEGLRAASRVQTLEAAVVAARSHLDGLAANGILTPGTTTGAFDHGIRWRQTIADLSTQSSSNQSAAPGALRPYWITLVAVDASGAPLLQLETAKLAREPQP
jgi:general secretion pathway protein I